MELSIVLEPYAAVDDYPPKVDAASGPLLSKKYNPTPRIKSKTTRIQPEVAIEGCLPWVNSASVSLPFKKHRRSSSSGEANATLLEPQLAAKTYLPRINPTSAPLATNKQRRNSISNIDTTLLKPQVTIEGHLLWVKPTSAPQLTKKHRPSLRSTIGIPLPPQQWTLDTYQSIINPASIPLPTRNPCHHSNRTINILLPPQEWTIDTYQPIIDPASIPLPTITVTTPGDLTQKPSPSTSLPKIKKVYQDDVLDASRLHPNAAWSQLAQWTHKENLSLVTENEMLRLENRALKDMLVRFRRVLGEMGKGEQMEFQRVLGELEGVEKTEGAWCRAEGCENLD